MASPGSHVLNTVPETSPTASHQEPHSSTSISPCTIDPRRPVPSSPLGILLPSAPDTQRPVPRLGVRFDLPEDKDRDVEKVMKKPRKAKKIPLETTCDCIMCVIGVWFAAFLLVALLIM